MNEFYLFASSKDSLTFHPNNSSTSFTIQLPEELQLSGIWTCSLSSLKCVSKSNADLYVFSDILEESIVNSRKLPIMQYVSGKRGKIVRGFDGSIAPRVVRHRIGTIHIYITDAHLNKAPLTGEITTCTLRFVKISS